MAVTGTEWLGDPAFSRTRRGVQSDERRHEDAKTLDEYLTSSSPSPSPDVPKGLPGKTGF